MSLLFLSDQCVPAEITETLRRRGHHVILLREVLPIRSLDPGVIAKAQALRAILLSLNGDFADIVSYPPARFLGIVGIQLHNHPEIIPQLMAAAFVPGCPCAARVLSRQTVPCRSPSGPNPAVSLQEEEL